jgi:hypothetical protein
MHNTTTLHVASTWIHAHSMLLGAAFALVILVLVLGSGLWGKRRGGYFVRQHRKQAAARGRDARARGVALTSYEHELLERRRHWRRPR